MLLFYTSCNSRLDQISYSLLCITFATSIILLYLPMVHNYYYYIIMDYRYIVVHARDYTLEYGDFGPPALLGRALGMCADMSMP